MTQYVDVPDFPWPSPTTYDVLTVIPDGTQTLHTGNPDTGGGLLDTAQAVVAALPKSKTPATLIDAWVTGSRTPTDTP